MIVLMRKFPRSSQAFLSIVAFIALNGCSGDSIGLGITNSSKVFGALDLSHKAVTLSTVAPYDTLALVITPRAVSGEVLTETPTVRIRVNDGSDTTVLVLPDGRLVGHAYARQVRVLVTVTLGEVTRIDTLLVNVDTTVSTNPTRPLSAFTFEGNDQGLVSVCGESSPQPTLTVTDVEGMAVNEPAVSYFSSNPKSIKIDRFTGTVTPVCEKGAIGTPVWIYATTTFLGVQYIDSIQYTATVPKQAFSSILAKTGADGSETVAFGTPLITIGAGGVVYWYGIPFLGLRETGITFDTPDLVAATTDTVLGFFPIPPTGDGGNIPQWTMDPDIPLFDPRFGRVNARARKFPTPGTYQYRSSRFPTVTGTVTVLPNPSVSSQGH